MKHRAQTLGGEWVTGYYVRVREDYHQIITTEKAPPNDIITSYERDYETHFVYDIIPSTLSVETFKPDSTGQIIFGSFELDGVMTKGGDVVSWGSSRKETIELEDACFWFGNQEVSDMPLFSLQSEYLTIIGKQSEVGDAE